MTAKLSPWQFLLFGAVYPIRYAHGLLCYGLTLIPARICNHNHYRVWDVITYPFPNFNGCTVEVWDWISNFVRKMRKVLSCDNDICISLNIRTHAFSLCRLYLSHSGHVVMIGPNATSVCGMDLKTGKYLSMYHISHLFCSDTLLQHIVSFSRYSNSHYIRRSWQRLIFIIGNLIATK